MADGARKASVVAGGRSSANVSGERHARSLSKLLRPALFMLPTLLAIAYYGLLAADRYVSEAQFVVRTASKPVGTGSFGALLQMSGLSRSNDDVYSVQSYIGSRDAVREMIAKLPLREYYNRPEADFISRFPSLFYGSSIEHFHRFLGWMVTTSYGSTTGIMTLRVQAFRPMDAKAIADELLELSEQTVNRMNTRIQEDAIRNSLNEVKHNEQRLIDAQIAITRFRNSELMIDPIGSSLIVTEVIARLAAELTKLEAQIRETRAAAPDNPSLPSLRRRATALEDQIVQERSRISDTNGGLALKLAAFERLALEREFAKVTLAASAKGLEQARVEARRQQLYLERVVAPIAADYPMRPERLRQIWSAFSLNVIGLLVAWLIFSGVREHSSAP